VTLEEALADARATFPNFPEQIFTLWLDDRIRQNGWPPIGIEWAGFLDGKPITYWQSLLWHRAQVILRPEELSATAFSVVMQLVEAATGKSNMMSSYIPNTAERFNSCLQYILKNATTPGTIILHRSAMGTSIVEGNHRIAALLAAQSKMPPGSSLLPFDAWVASTQR
jgi:hypothetical protein